MSMRMTEIWTYGESLSPGLDLEGFKVEARDGEIGKVDKATNEAGGACIVVDTGPWIFGKKVMLPAGVVREVELDSESVFVDLTKDEIKNSPEYDDSRYDDPAYRDELGRYYGGMGGDRS